MIVNCRRNSGERGNVLAEEAREMGKKKQMIFFIIINMSVWVSLCVLISQLTKHSASLIKKKYYKNKIS